MKYCNQQFPVVKYLEAPDHKFSYHKIRYFLCSLNPVGFFAFSDKLFKITISFINGSTCCSNIKVKQSLNETNP